MTPNASDFYQKRLNDSLIPKLPPPHHSKTLTGNVIRLYKQERSEIHHCVKKSALSSKQNVPVPQTAISYKPPPQALHLRISHPKEKPPSQLPITWEKPERAKVENSK